MIDFTDIVKRILEIHMEAQRVWDIRATPGTQNRASVIPAVTSNDSAEPQEHEHQYSDRREDT